MTLYSSDRGGPPGSTKGCVAAEQYFEDAGEKKQRGGFRPYQKHPYAQLNVRDRMLQAVSWP